MIAIQHLLFLLLFYVSFILHTNSKVEQIHENYKVHYTFGFPTSWTMPQNSRLFNPADALLEWRKRTIRYSVTISVLLLLCSLC